MKQEITTTKGDEKGTIESLITFLKQAQKQGGPLLDQLEKEVDSLLDNTWGDTAKAVVNNWLGLVYRLTNLDRNQQFMEDVNPADPLGIKIF